MSFASEKSKEFKARFEFMDTSLRSVWQWKWILYYARYDKGEINRQDKAVWQFYKYDKNFVSMTKFKGLVWIFYEFEFFFICGR